MERENLDEASLEDLALEVAEILRPGDVVVLSGEVGSGKTTFVRAAARALGIKVRVTSPTYQLARSYSGRISGSPVVVNHLDLYRLDGLPLYDALDLEEYLSPDAITFVEWAEPALEAIEESTESMEAPSLVEFSHETSKTRRLRLSGPLAGRLKAER